MALAILMRRRQQKGRDAADISDIRNFSAMYVNPNHVVSVEPITVTYENGLPVGGTSHVHLSDGRVLEVFGTVRDIDNTLNA